jgi:hypothetical protein
VKVPRSLAARNSRLYVIDDVHDVVVVVHLVEVARDIFAAVSLLPCGLCDSRGVYNIRAECVLRCVRDSAKPSSVPLASVASRRCRYRHRTALEQYRAGAKNETRHRGLVNDVLAASRILDSGDASHLSRAQVNMYIHRFECDFVVSDQRFF